LYKDKIFIARQPILDLNDEIQGYELLFRATNVNSANIDDHALASARVIFDTLSNFGFQKVVGPHKGFINLNNDMLMSDSLELLPPSLFVLELLEIVEITNAVIERCRELKLKGFTLALDDNLISNSYLPLYDLVDIVKIDVLSMSAERLARMSVMLKRWPVKLLAEKVETVNQQQFCRELGFTLFQGYYFARPMLIKQNRIDSSREALMRLLNQVLKDASFHEIENTFKLNPDLTYKLLRLVNSVMFGLREKISTLKQAIVTIGMQHLKRWVLMALFSNRDADSPQSPLLELSAVRGRLMEKIVDFLPHLKSNPDQAELAFMTGLLSLLDVQMGMPLEELADQLNLSDDLRLALLGREGDLGLLLSLCECLEQDNGGGVAEILGRIGLDEPDFLKIQLEVIEWTNSLCSSIQ
jgi:EAL and modified HD-GYP domain-containing signal transduction protein